MYLNLLYLQIHGLLVVISERGVLDNPKRVTILLSKCHTLTAAIENRKQRGYKRKGAKYCLRKDWKIKVINVNKVFYSVSSYPSR